MAYPMDSVAEYYIPLKATYSITRTISLISHTSKVILNWLKPQAEKMIDKEQSGFRVKGSIRELTVNLGSCVKSTQTPAESEPCLHCFLFFFKRKTLLIEYAALWATVPKYNISVNLVRSNEQLYDQATSQMNGSLTEWFRTFFSNG